MLCNSEWFTVAVEQFVWTPCNLVNHPDEEHVINTFHICTCFGLIVWIELSI